MNTISVLGALVKVANYFLMVADSGLLSVLVLIDLSSAFDVDHNILLQRIEHAVGIKGTVLPWFESYLPNRLQFVHLIGESSTHTPN